MINQQSAINNPQSKKPLIFSIVTPSYNQLDWLRLCVASVREQLHAWDRHATRQRVLDWMGPEVVAKKHQELYEKLKC